MRVLNLYKTFSKDNKKKKTGVDLIKLYKKKKINQFKTTCVINSLNLDNKIVTYFYKKNTNINKTMTG